MPFSTRIQLALAYLVQPRWIRLGWRILAPLPSGRALYTKVLGLAIPYTGALGARVCELAPGRARVRLQERRGVRNHLGSVHAVALVNLAELAGNLALACALPPGARFIVEALNMEYLHKARGTIDAFCQCEIPTGLERQSRLLAVTLTDEGGREVARAQIKTLIGPDKSTPQRSGSV
jgi:uncharacterized protein (TIGR00369 family)